MARHFENWLRAYVTHTEIGEAPKAFHFWTGVSTIAGALRRKVWVDQLHFRWWANFYIILVGPAGLVTKSTSIGLGMKLLQQVEGVYFGPRSITWQALVRSMKEAAQEVPLRDEDGKYNIRTDSPITVFVSEMGTFFKMEDSTMMDVLTDLWDSPEGPWKHTTITSGDAIIENPWINIIACTTPTWIKEHFPEQLIGGGLASRMLFVFGDKKERLVPYPALQIRPERYRETEKFLVEDLQEISLLKGPYDLSPEALDWGSKWYTDHWYGPRPQHLASSRYAAYLGRKQAYLHKLALILAAAKRNDQLITKDDLVESLALIEDLEPSMLRVFESIGQVDEARKVDELVQFLFTYESLTSDELWKLVSNIMTTKEFGASLSAAVKSQKLQVVSKDGARAVRLHPEYIDLLKAKEKKSQASSKT